MKKEIFICDFCKKENNNIKKYTLPMIDFVEAVGGEGNIKLFSWPNIKDKEIDICPRCRDILASIINSTDWEKE